MKIVIDKAIPFTQGVFETQGCNVVYLPGAEITAKDVHDATALIVRTRTKCDATLLEGSSVKVVATATIGTDHLDIPWMESHGIKVFSAPGCNAGGVSSWVVTAIFAMCHDALRTHPTVGVIGVGNVGSRVEKALRTLGFKVFRYDPPRAAREGRSLRYAPCDSEEFCTLSTITDLCDIVTVHLPLADDTRDFISTDFFAALKKPIIFLNSSRGECCSTPAILKAHQDGLITHLAIDTFPHEPAIERSLVEICDICTPHIAGYSLLGKINGTTMAVRAVARETGLVELENYSVDPSGLDKPLKIALPRYDHAELSKIYDILAESELLRCDIQKFEYIRAHYNHRSELDL